MTGLCDHRIVLVERALARWTSAAVRMQIGKDTQSGLPTEFPKRAETCSIEDDNAGVETRWVEVVIVCES